LYDTNVKSRRYPEKINLMKNKVIDTWNKDKIVYEGTYEQCLNYIRGNNIYQSNYSKLKLL